MIKRTYVSESDSIKSVLSLILFPSMNQDYDPYEIKLAHEIANTLGDRDSIALHLQYARKYKEEFLRKTLNKVMSLDESKIKRSRAALYTFLINQSSRYGDSGH